MTLNLWCEDDERATRHRLAGLLARELDVDVLLLAAEILVVSGAAGTTFDEAVGAARSLLA